MALQNISAVIITKNAAATLGRTLASLERFSEVIVYDNGSSDNTQEIARSFTNVRLSEGAFLGFGPTKNHAVSLARHDWVLSIDADEVLSEELLDEIDQLSLKDRREAFMIHRINLFMGKAVKHSGWGNDWLVRIFCRSVHRFSDAMVHESIALHGQSRVRKLKSAMLHYAVTDLSQFIAKINHYSEIRKDNATRRYSLPTLVFKSAWAFFRTYILRAGFLDGWRGLVIAVSNANGVFYKNIKIYAAKQQ